MASLGALGLFIVVSITRSTSEAVNAARRATQALAQGDLTQHLSQRRP